IESGDAEVVEGHLEEILRAREGLVALVDVDAAPDEAAKLARDVGKGRTSAEDVTVDAVEASQPIFHLERLAATEVIEIDPERTVHVVWMHALDPAIADLLLQLTSGEVEPGGVEVVV